MDVEILTVDAHTREPLPCRLSFASEPGFSLWDHDAAGAPMAYLGQPRIWSPGRWQGELPDRTVTVCAARPYEYHTAQRVIAPQDSGRLVLRLQRRSDMGALGWYCGDAHQHVVHGEAVLQVDLPRAAAVAAAEGTDWMVFDGRFTSIAGQREPGPGELSRLCTVSSSRRFTAFWADEYPKHDLGHLACLPSDVDLAPSAIGGSGVYRLESGVRTPYTVFEQIRALQRHGTTAIYVHPTRELGGIPGRPGNIARELALDTLVAPWAVEAIDLMSDRIDDPVCRAMWYRLLNRGHRIGLCAFNDACYDRAGDRWHEPVAYRRTYVHTRSAPARAALIKAIRTGQTFGTTGPLVQFRIAGAGPGDCLLASPLPRRAAIRAWGAPAYRDPRQAGQIARVELVRNGELYHAWDFTGRPRDQVELNLSLAEQAAAWYLVRVHGTLPEQLAITSPVYVEDGVYVPPQPVTAHVKARINDARTGQPLHGRFDLVEYSHGQAQVRKAGCFGNGHLELDMAADLRLCVRVDGYVSQSLSPVLHCDSIYYDLLGPIRGEDLARAEYYQQLKAALQRVQLHFRLERLAG